MQALLAGLLLLIISGCTFIQEDPVSLMKKPDLPTDKATLNGAIQSALLKNKLEGSIVRPRSDVDSSSIRIHDLDNDGIMEAVVFYQTPDDEVKIHGMIMREGDTWVKKLDFDGEGTVLESLISSILRMTARSTS